MPRFIGYTTYENEDPVILSKEEFEQLGIPEGWAEYVWINAQDKGDALARYPSCMEAFEADNASCRPIRDAY